MPRLQYCLLLLVGGLAACSSSPPVHYYTLAASGEPKASAAARGPSLVVGPISVPERIDRMPMVRLEGPRLEVADAHRWAAPLKAELASRVAATLAQASGWERVVAAPQNSVAAPELSLPIDVGRFEAKGFESVTLEAVWTLRRGGLDVASGSFVATEPLEDATYTALAAAHGRLADALARSIAARLPPG